RERALHEHPCDAEGDDQSSIRSHETSRDGDVYCTHCGVLGSLSSLFGLHSWKRGMFGSTMIFATKVSVLLDMLGSGVMSTSCVWPGKSACVVVPVPTCVSIALVCTKRPTVTPAGSEARPMLRTKAWASRGVQSMWSETVASG